MKRASKQKRGEGAGGDRVQIEGSASTSTSTSAPVLTSRTLEQASTTATTNGAVQYAHLETPARIATTQRTRRFLTEVSRDNSLPQDLRDRVKAWADKPHVPWVLLDEACSAASKHYSGSSDTPYDLPSFSSLIFEGNLSLQAPPARVRSKELEERLARLQRELDEKTYRDMVKGVVRKEEEARDQEDAAFRTYKDQLGFGLNVIFTMFTLFVFCYFVARTVTQNEALRMLAGLLGAIFAMLMETTLLITRTTYTLKDRVAFTKKYL